MKELYEEPKFWNFSYCSRFFDEPSPAVLRNEKAKGQS
jgi:hypothetical protein